MYIISKTEENVLVERAQGQDVQAFTEIYELYQKGVYNFVYSKTSKIELSEDITQETFLKMLERINDFKGNCRLLNWLCQIAHNIAKDVGKSSEYKNVTAQEITDDSAFVPIDFDSPDQYAIANDTTAHVQAALDKLPERTARIMRLFLVDNLSYKEISKITSVSVGRCKSIVSENRKRLQGLLATVWEEYQACNM